MSYVDLHIHSCYSDGTYTIDEIISIAKKNNVTFLAVADHNVLGGSKELLNNHNNENDIKFISAVELDCLHANINFHVLGYNVDLKNKAFNKRVKENEALLEQVNIKLLKKMKKDYKSISLKEYYNFKYDKTLGGWKTLYYFMHLGITNTVQEGYALYKKYNHNYNCVNFFSLSEICKWIHDAGGSAILAHPGRNIVFKDKKELFSKLKSLLNAGIDGIECYYPSHDEQLTSWCLEFCKTYNLYISSGSDCHGGFTKSEIGILKTDLDKINI